MNHEDHVRLMRGGIDTTGGVWADFGAGTGAFTLALAEILGPDGEIYAVDRDINALRTQEQEMRTRYKTPTHYLKGDFTAPLDLPSLDGVVIANALHFYRDKSAVLALIKRYLKPHGRLILVEYNVDHGNTWVPYPLSFPTWQQLAQNSGFAQTRLLARVPSRFLKEIYSAVSSNLVD